MSSAAKIDLKYPNSKFLKSEFYFLFLYLNSVVANRVLDNSFTSFKLNGLEKLSQSKSDNVDIYF